jgi:hypothetical protein
MIPVTTRVVCKLNTKPLGITSTEEGFLGEVITAFLNGKSYTYRVRLDRGVVVGNLSEGDLTPLPES